MTEPPSLQKKFPSLYKNLSDNEQVLLKLLSVFYDKVSRTTVVKGLNQAGLRNKKGNNYVNNDLKPLLKTLEELQLISMNQTGVRCDEQIAELATRQAVADKSFENMAITVQRVVKSKQPWSADLYFQTYLQGVRDVRIALYRGRKADIVSKIFSQIARQFPRELWESHPYRLVFENPFDKNLLYTLDIELIEDIVNILLNNSFYHLTAADDFYLFVEEYCDKKAENYEKLLALLSLQYVLRGHFDKAGNLIRDWRHSSRALSYHGWLAFLEGHNDRALMLYRQGLVLMKKESGRRNVCYSNIAGVFYLVALLQSGKTENMHEALRYLAIVKKQKESFLSSVYDDLAQTFLLAMGQQKKAAKILHSLLLERYSEYFSVFIAYLTLFWQGKSLEEGEENFLMALQQEAQKAGYFWLAKESTALLCHFNIHAAASQEFYKKLKQQVPGQDLIEIVRAKENWEQALTALIALQNRELEQIGQQDSRLVWLIYLDEDFGEYTITPKLQKLGKNGKWTKGRAVALKTLAEDASSLGCLTGQDKEIVSTISKRYKPGRSFYGGYASTSYEFDYSLALPQLVGHPLLFWEMSPLLNVELISGSPELHVLKRKKGFEIRLYPVVHDNLSFVLVKESPTSLKLVSVRDEYQRVAEIIGESIIVPEHAKEMVLKAVSAVAPFMTVQSDIGGAAEDIKAVQADLTPYIHILPYDEGLKVELLFKPFRDGGSFYRPGSGGMVVLAEIDGKQLQTSRDLDSEKKNAAEIISHCQVLDRLEMINHEWIVDDAEDCLELIYDLQELGDKVNVEWPQGGKLKVSNPVSAGQFSLSIKRDNDWFAATGNVKVEDGLVLDMKKLLAISERTESRFVKLDDGRFLALTRAFKKRLEEISSFSEPHGKGVRFNPLTGPALEEFTSEVGKLKVDTHWKNNVKRFQPLPEPKLPTTLQAKLRDYQHDGFKWLACLSAWQVGGCLADDMGLGKTVQALSAILIRAADGPTLVVAPTSVMMNWQDEAERFAPTLNVIFFGPGDRQQILNELQPFDLVICSYGLLQSEGEMLAGVSWQIVVLDEAQAIKNMATKRSKAAMALQAQFRIITTGTPIENHLGELWNLFRFINPGLLGTLESFNQKFALPIEKFKDKEARKRLKKLIQPFILRRLKQDVLQELPPRTEITMRVEMSSEEAAMYEAQRHLALEKLADVDGQAGAKHMQILAEITRLRRFCCNPQLVLPEAGISSSKLKVFGQVVDELLENNHKTLVFSQFVGHLHIIQEYLEKKKVSCQYLDGGTSVKERKKRVQAFQAGKGDVFLISLKAGGSGLNLTAADYVIHMDPWWNPAVEDQASDRVHRIGQKRPVTVYRLVVQDTIEEKIVALHKHKRDLADQLLEGSEVSGRISSEQLLKLLTEG